MACAAPDQVKRYQQGTLLAQSSHRTAADIFNGQSIFTHHDFPAFRLAEMIDAEHLATLARIPVPALRHTGLALIWQRLYGHPR